MKITIFNSRLFQNTHQNESIVHIFKNFITRITTYSKRVSKIFIYKIENDNYNYFWKKLVFFNFLYKNGNF